MSQKKMLMEAVDAILHGIEVMLHDLKDEFDNKLEVTNNEVRHNRRLIEELKYDSLTRREFDELKTRVNKIKSTI